MKELNIQFYITSSLCFVLSICLHSKVYGIYLTRTHVAHFQMLTSCYFLKLFSGLALTKCFRERIVKILFAENVSILC